MTIRRLGMPWAAPGDRTYSLPNSLIVKLALGEAPDAAPALADVRRGAAAAAASIDGGPVDRIVTRYAGGVRACRLHAAARSAGALGRGRQGFDEVEQLTGVARTFVLQAPTGTSIGALVDSLAQVTTVESASPNYVCVTPYEASPRGDPMGEDAWAARLMVRAAEALAYEPGDPAVMVGLVDSGVAPDHPELSGRLRAGYDTVQLGGDDVAPGIILMGDHRRDDSNPVDLWVGHGMGCAGVMSALGLGMPPGLAGQSQIIPMRALGAAKLPGKPIPVGLGAIADLDAAVKRAVDLGAKVINMSFGSDDAALAPSSPKPHADVVRYALERGCILVAASGNNGADTRYWPAAYPGVIAVGAVGADRHACAFSTRGDHVALCAPGERVLTAGLTGYQSATGTSFAAPFVAGAAALLAARAARRAVPIDGAIVAELLTRTAQPFAGGPAPGCGAGILDAAAALAALDAFIDAALPEEERADDG
ncbi:S8 family serine peptidase [Phenylobacterium sp. LjRoot225]|uniref:S8 family peptidase n=1 Tax=Phenylobacterium sp. LjRoot225 TaxID=3342285 RepID=UPI003ECD6517